MICDFYTEYSHSYSLRLKRKRRFSAYHTYVERPNIISYSNTYHILPLSNSGRGLRVLSIHPIYRPTLSKEKEERKKRERKRNSILAYRRSYISYILFASLAPEAKISTLSTPKHTPGSPTTALPPSLKRDSLAEDEEDSTDTYSYADAGPVVPPPPPLPLPLPHSLSHPSIAVSEEEEGEEASPSCSSSSSRPPPPPFSSLFFNNPLPLSLSPLLVDSDRIKDPASVTATDSGSVSAFAPPQPPPRFEEAESSSLLLPSSSSSSPLVAGGTTASEITTTTTTFTTNNNSNNKAPPLRLQPPPPPLPAESKGETSGKSPDDRGPPPPYTEGDSPIDSFSYVMAAAGGPSSIITQVQQVGGPPINTLGGMGFAFTRMVGLC